MSIDAVFDDLMSSGGGIPSAKFPTIGTVVRGTIVSIEKVPQLDMAGKPKLWKDGTEREQWKIVLQTDERDPSIDGDEGKRALYAYWHLEQAFKDALHEGGATKHNTIGGTLAVEFTGEDEPTGPGLNPPKLYRAQFQPGSAAAADLLAEQPAATPAPAPAAAPQPAADSLI